MIEKENQSSEVAAPRVPRPASSPPPAGGGLSYAVRRAALHPRSELPPPRRFRSPFPFARRPRSRLGIPARWKPVRGKASIPPGVVSTGSGASVRRDLPGFASACVHPCPENGSSQMFLPIPRRQPTRLRSSPRRITPLSFANPAKCKKKQPPHPKRRAAVAAEDRSICAFQLSGLWPGWFRRLSR